jgi:hypothetical protein
MQSRCPSYVLIFIFQSFLDHMIWGLSKNATQSERLTYLAACILDHLIWGSNENVGQLDRLISGLGSLAAHGPPMLAWTLSTYLARGEQGLGKSARLGMYTVQYRSRITLLIDLALVQGTVLIDWGPLDWSAVLID